VTLVNNNSSGLHLGSGMAPVARMVERCRRVAVGIDGSAFDEDDDAVRETAARAFTALGRAVAMQLEPELLCELPPGGGTRPGRQEAPSD
jgi:cytosine/adenosine deaminase-related metal-dependent hydrolase